METAPIASADPQSPSTSHRRLRRAARTISRTFGDSFRLLRRHRRSYLILSAAGLVCFSIGAGATLAFPDLQAQTVGGATRQLDGSLLGNLVAGAYQDGNVPAAALTTFLINLLVGSVLTMTVPSLLVPFFGVAFLCWRTYQWGIIFSPFAADGASLAPHYVTLVLEGQAYVLVALAALLAGRMLLRPADFGLTSHRAGWVEGVRTTARLYPLVVAVLVVAAVYEALEVIHLV